jgi:hypothetical protein
MPLTPSVSDAPMPRGLFSAFVVIAAVLACRSQLHGNLSLLTILSAEKEFVVETVERALTSDSLDVLLGRSNHSRGAWSKPRNICAARASANRRSELAGSRLSVPDGRVSTYDGSDPLRSFTSGRSQEAKRGTMLSAARNSGRFIFAEERLQRGSPLRSLIAFNQYSAESR